MHDTKEMLLLMMLPFIVLFVWLVLPYLLFGEMGLIGSIFTFGMCWLIELYLKRD